MKELDLAYDFFLASEYAKAIEVFNQLLTADLPYEIRKKIVLLSAATICFAVEHEEQSCVIV